MRVAVDARQLAVPTRATARYIEALVLGLHECPGVEPILYANRPLDHLPASLRTFPQAISPFTFTVRIDWLAAPWEQLFLPKSLVAERADLWHATFNYGVPHRCPVPAVLTIHDVAQFLAVPKRDALRIPPINWHFYQQFRLSAARADQIITVSEHSKRDILRMFGPPADRVTVVYEGADSSFRRLFNRTLVAESIERHGLKNEYIVYAGGLEPRKNVETLISAFSLIAGRTEADLVIIGSVNAYARRLKALVAELGLDKRVRFLGFVPNADFVALLNGATVAAYPSLYEGFGLPPLEAMACGVPVVSSNSSSLPEVVGDAALLVAPHDTEGFAEALLQALTHQGLQESMRERGYERVAAFPQKRMIEQTLAVYEGAMAAFRGRAKRK